MNLLEQSHVNLINLVGTVTTLTDSIKKNFLEALDSCKDELDTWAKGQNWSIVEKETLKPLS